MKFHKIFRFLLITFGVFVLAITLLSLFAFYYFSNLPPFGCRYASFNDKIYSVFVNTPEGHLAPSDLSRLRAYNRLYSADYYLDFKDYGYLIINLDGSVLGRGEEEKFGYKLIDTKEFCKLAKSANRVLKDSDKSIGEYLKPLFEYKSSGKVKDEYLIENNNFGFETEAYKITKLDDNTNLFTNNVDGFSINIPNNWKILWHYPTYLEFKVNDDTSVLLKMEPINRNYVIWDNIYNNLNNKYKKYETIDGHSVYQASEDYIKGKNIKYYVDGKEGENLPEFSLYSKLSTTVFNSKDINNVLNAVKSFRKISTGFKSYNDVEKGISIKYPNLGIVNKNSNNVAITKNDSSYTITNYIVKNTKYDPHEYKYVLERALTDIKLKGDFTDEERISYSHYNSVNVVKYHNPKTGAYKYVAYAITYKDDSDKITILEDNSLNYNFDEFMFIAFTLDAGQRGVIHSIPGIDY